MASYLMKYIVPVTNRHLTSDISLLSDWKDKANMVSRLLVFSPSSVTD